jgi:hypothetical protein
MSYLLRAIKSTCLMPRVFLVCNCTLQIWLGASSIHAQQVPPAPVDGIRDDTRALSEGSRQQLAKEIVDFRGKHGIDAWFVATTFLREGQTLRSEARLLRQAWSGERPAVLLLYDRAKDLEMVTYAPLLWERLSTADLFSLRDTVHSMMADKTKPPEQRLRESMRELLRSMSAMQTFESKAAEVYTRDYFRLLRTFATALMLGAIIFGIAGVLARRSDRHASQVCLMPSIEVPPRLGAAHGGGTAAVSDAVSLQS